MLKQWQGSLKPTPDGIWLACASLREPRNKERTKSFQVEQKIRLFDSVEGLCVLLCRSSRCLIVVPLKLIHRLLSEGCIDTASTDYHLRHNLVEFPLSAILGSHFIFASPPNVPDEAKLSLAEINDIIHGDGNIQCSSSFFIPAQMLLFRPARLSLISRNRPLHRTRILSWQMVGMIVLNVVHSSRQVGELSRARVFDFGHFGPGSRILLLEGVGRVSGSPLVVCPESDPASHHSPSESDGTRSDPIELTALSLDVSKRSISCLDTLVVTASKTGQKPIFYALLRCLVGGSGPSETVSDTSIKIKQLFKQLSQTWIGIHFQMGHNGAAFRIKIPVAVKVPNAKIYGHFIVQTLQQQQRQQQQQQQHMIFKNNDFFISFRVQMMENAPGLNPNFVVRLHQTCLSEPSKQTTYMVIEVTTVHFFFTAKNLLLTHIKRETTNVPHRCRESGIMQKYTPGIVGSGRVCVRMRVAVIGEGVVSPKGVDLARVGET
ncbi:hypothetical protein HUJ04_012667 [Dendroctonus ponderosae]|nr:hypothetical protein HUJ04_012667 [Dendroctonus ponderosae]